MSKDVDEVLLRLARRGDSAALVKLATRWWIPVYRVVWNLLGSASEAAEATEQTLLLVVRFPESVDCDVPFGISLYGAAIDFSLLRCPPARRSPAESLDVFLPRFDARGCLVLPGEDWSHLTDGLLQRPDLAETIRGMLQRLDDLDRAAFVLREIEQFSVEETVAILRIPADEVRARAHRATTLLTGLLGRMRRISGNLQASNSTR
jgi:RNA polymerase sigma-70 factor (ECF subfamily)